MSRNLIFIFLLFMTVNQINGQNTAFVNSGNENLLKRDYKEALNNFNLALKENPSNVQAMCGSAQAQNGLGNYTEAMSFAESALKLAPQSDLANFVKGEILVSNKDYAGAINLFNKSIEINKSLFPAYVGKSKAYNLMGDLKEAYKVLDNAIDAFPSSAELFLARGLLNNGKEKYSKALSDFDKAISLNEKSNAFAAYYNRGIAYSFLEEYDSAIADFNKAAELDPSNANVFYSRGLAFYQMESYEPSVNDFLKADALSPNNPVTYYNLGMAFYKLEKLSDACLYFHKSCGLKNTNACKMIIMVCSDKPKQ